MHHPKECALPLPYPCPLLNLRCVHSASDERYSISLSLTLSLLIAHLEVCVDNAVDEQIAVSPSPTLSLPIAHLEVYVDITTLLF